MITSKNQQQNKNFRRHDDRRPTRPVAPSPAPVQQKNVADVLECTISNRNSRNDGFASVDVVLSKVTEARKRLCLALSRDTTESRVLEKNGVVAVWLVGHGMEDTVTVFHQTVHVDVVPATGRDQRATLRVSGRLPFDAANAALRFTEDVLNYALWAKRVADAILHEQGLTGIPGKPGMVSEPEPGFDEKTWAERFETLVKKLIGPVYEERWVRAQAAGAASAIPAPPPAPAPEVVKSEEPEVLQVPEAAKAEEIVVPPVPKVEEPVVSAPKVEEPVAAAVEPAVAQDLNDRIAELELEIEQLSAQAVALNTERVKARAASNHANTKSLSKSGKHTALGLKQAYAELNEKHGICKKALNDARARLQLLMDERLRQQPMVAAASA